MKGTFDGRLSSVKGCLPSKVVFLQRSSSVICRLPRQRLSSVKGRMVQKTLNPFIQKGSTDPQTGGLFIQMEIRLETPEIAKRGTDTEGGTYTSRV